MTGVGKGEAPPVGRAVEVANTPGVRVGTTIMTERGGGGAVGNGVGVRVDTGPHAMARTTRIENTKSKRRTDERDLRLGLEIRD